LNFNTSGDQQHLDLSAPADLLDRSYNSTYNGSSNTSSSKAVLAALRALQDKIRRLESERTQALDETVQLRHQLKNQEVEADHAKQREQLQAQKSLQEVRSAYERLLTDKSELEVRLSKYEEKNKQAQGNVDDLQARIRILEDDKHAGTMKLKDLEHQKIQVETQIKLAQQKEEGTKLLLKHFERNDLSNSLFSSLILQSRHSPWYGKPSATRKPSPSTSDEFSPFKTNWQHCARTKAWPTPN